MIRNLCGAGRIEAAADVLVIGAGTVGLVLATELAAIGKRVICLESGSREQASETHPLNLTEQAGTPYAGAESGRARCLGGTSTIWGGALIPFQESDIANARWPIEWKEFSPYLHRVETLFGLPPGNYEESDATIARGFVTRLAKWPAFGQRNVYSLLRGKIESISNLEIWINATATGFAVKDGRMVSVVAESADGDSIKVAADQIVFAAGAIESTRLLLLLSDQNPGSITGTGLGEGFHDHLSAVVATLIVRDRSALNKVVGFQFAPGGAMRNVRFELPPRSIERERVVPCFAHVGFSETQGGFSALRDIFRALQRRRLPTVTEIGALVLHSPWLFKAIWWRYRHRRLLYPKGADLQLHIVIEQRPAPENRIDLSTRATDIYGQPLARIHWTVRQEDVTAMERAIEYFKKNWESGPIARLATLDFRPKVDIYRDMEQGGGIYHPGGSTRMAESADHGVVDRELRVFGLTNAYVCSTSVFPTGGGANPTMMLLSLGLRLVDRLKSP